MIKGHVPTGRKPNSWVGNIVNKSQYKILLSTGMAWVLFPDLPESWEACEKVLKEKEDKLTKEIIVVSAAWCAQCSVLKDTLTRAGVIYKVVDADSPEGMDFCRENGVRSLPTSFVYEDGELKKTLIGLKKIEEYV